MTREVELHQGPDGFRRNGLIVAHDSVCVEASPTAESVAHMRWRVSVDGVSQRPGGASELTLVVMI